MFAGGGFEIALPLANTSAWLSWALPSKRQGTVFQGGIVWDCRLDSTAQGSRAKVTHKRHLLCGELPAARGEGEKLPVTGPLC